jgi:hypothetical protein
LLPAGAGDPADPYLYAYAGTGTTVGYTLSVRTDGNSDVKARIARYTDTANRYATTNRYAAIDGDAIADTYGTGNTQL